MILIYVTFKINLLLKKQCTSSARPTDLFIYFYGLYNAIHNSVYIVLKDKRTNNVFGKVAVVSNILAFAWRG
jgi:hypothetical protein